MVKFQDVLKDVKERNQRSDMENLAHAHDMVDREIARLLNLKARIVELGDLADIPEGAVKKLYDEAMGRLR